MQSDYIIYYIYFFHREFEWALKKKGLSWTWKVLLSLVKKIWQRCQGVILIPTLDCSTERRDFQAVTTPWEPAAPVRQKNKETTHVSPTSDCFTLFMVTNSKQHKSVIVSNVSGRCKAPFCSAAYLTKHVEKKGADPFCGSILPQHTTPKQKRTFQHTA